MSEISLEGHPGRLLKERMRDGSIMRVKMFLVGQRLYQVAVTTPREEGAKAETVRFYETTASKFLDSFKLISTEQKTLGEVDRFLLENKGAAIVGSCDPNSPGCKPAPGKQGIVTGGILNGKAVSLPAPVYTALARATHASGTVGIQVVIDEEGKVIAAQAVSGNPLLFATCLNAARQARFSPTLLDGKPVKIAGVINYNFVAR
jgi:TonB family protein